MKKRVRLKLPDLPAVTPEALDSFDAYLTDVISQAVRARVNAYRSRRKDDMGCQDALYAYWRNAVSALCWLRGNIRQTRIARGRPGGGRHGAPSNG